MLFQAADKVTAEFEPGTRLREQSERERPAGQGEIGGKSGWRAD